MNQNDEPDAKAMQGEGEVSGVDGHRRSRRRIPIDPAHRHRLIGAALLVLHLAWLPDVEGLLRGGIVAAHIALVLVWQPVTDPSARLRSDLAGTALVLAALVLWLDNMLILGAWLLILLGLVGGEQPRSRRDNFAQWLAMAYLTTLLLIGTTPALFAMPGADSPALTGLLHAASVLPLALLFVRSDTDTSSQLRFDYIRALGITSLTLVLMLGSALWSLQLDTAYPLALLMTAATAATLLLAINWAWRHRTHDSILQILFNRYLLSIGTPLEQYLLQLSGPAAQELPPGRFLNHAIETLARFGWVEGVRIATPEGVREAGSCHGHETSAVEDELEMLVYTRQAPGPALALHIHLLGRLVEQLWRWRRREAELRSQTQARTIHETGAQLTHDIKNLLQSLQTLSAAVGSTPPERADEAIRLVQRQLPPINRRLHATLQKLRSPTDHDSVPVSLSHWWNEARDRFGLDNVHFVEDLHGSEPTVPRELFDTVAENLVENARYKQHAQRDLRIEVRLSTTDDHVCFEVCDSGRPVPEALVDHLFVEAVESEQGLGIGLYQSARLAEQHGYRLSLAENRQGRVCFRLEGAREAPAAQH